MSQRRPGRVVQIRVAPRDCLSVIDVWDKLGISIEGASFSQLVSTALASAMESFRKNGIIPERDGFEYNEMMSRFPDLKADRARKLSISGAMFAQDVRAVVPETLEVKLEKRRLGELKVKMEHAFESVTPEELAEFQRLQMKYE